MVSEPERDQVGAEPGIEFEGVSYRLMETYERLFAEHQKLSAQLIRLIDQIHEDADLADTEFVGDALALVMNCHPETGRSVLANSVLVCSVPGLMEAMEAGELTERHVHAASDELHRCLADREVRTQVLALVLAQCRARVARGRRWPFPGQLRRMIRKHALLADLDAAQRREQQMRQDRCVVSSLLPDGAVSIGITGPAARCAAMHEAIDARAHALRRVGDERTLDQLRFDAAFALLTGEQPADGGVGPAGHAQIIVPISTAQGGSLELGELVGYGPLLPSTARELLGQAATVSRVCIDARTGQVISVDKPRPHNGGPVDWMLTEPVPSAPEPGQGYRPSPSTARLVKTRDQTCRFPGCRKLSVDCDLDHRTPWPRGSTDATNLQTLCRHHHRAKQSGMFTITTEPDGTIVWTNRIGQAFQSPPPEW